MAIIEYSEYKGNKLIVIKRNETDRYPFRFGKTKAKLIVENFDEIKKFAEEEDEGAASGAEESVD